MMKNKSQLIPLTLLQAVSLTCVAIAILLFAIAMISPSIHSSFSFLAGVAGCTAFLFTLCDLYKRRVPVPTRSGENLSLEENPIAYRFSYGLFALFGVVGLFVFLSVYVIDGN